jgi:hypothetical protein
LIPGKDKEIFLFPETSTLALGITQFPLQLVLEALALEVK